MPIKSLCFIETAPWIDPQPTIARSRVHRQSESVALMPVVSSRATTEQVSIEKIHSDGDGGNTPTLNISAAQSGLMIEVHGTDTPSI